MAAEQDTVDTTPLIQLRKKNREKIHPNDIFALKVLDYGYFYGRVVEVDISEFRYVCAGSGFGFKAGDQKCWICCYIYDSMTNQLVTDIERLSLDKLLCGPLLLTNHAWRDGLFMKIGNEPIGDQEKSLHTNSFYWNRVKRYVDMHGNFLDKPVVPCGEYGCFITHHGIYAILREALGDPIIYDEVGTDSDSTSQELTPMEDYPEEIRIELNGTDLPDEVYESCDLLAIDEMLEEIDEDEEHFVGGNSERTDKSVLYRVFCVSAKEAWKLIGDAITSYPLCQKAAVSLIDRNGEVMQRFTIGE